MTRTPKRRRDPNQLAKFIVDLASGEATDVRPLPPVVVPLVWIAQRPC
jgi:hypothetical protein